MLQVANALVGNPDTAACIEFSLLGPSVEFCDGPRLIAVVGDVDVKLNDAPITAFQSVLCQPGDVLKVGVLKSHNYGYLAVSGGVDTPLLYGSRATHARAGMGGFEGRALRDDDVLPLALNQAEQALELPEKYVKSLLQLNEVQRVEVVLGPQDDAFPSDQIELFLNGTYTVGQDTDRMGMRLAGPPLKHKTGADILSDGIAPGSIQVPGSGLPIVLLAERQTIGGYTKIATVVSCCLDAFSQLRPGTELSFVALPPREAIDLSRAHHVAFQTLLQAIRPVLSSIRLADLMHNNLISGVVDGDERA